METDIAFAVRLNLPYQAAIEKTTAALKEEGFGVLTEIDVKATLKEKLGEDVRPYAILGTCNPPLAHKALESDPLMGLMLPCNVIVWETDQGTEVAIINPAMLAALEGLRDNPGIQEVADQAQERLARVAAALRKLK